MILSLKISYHKSSVSLHYLVKCQCLKSNNWKQDDFCNSTFKSALSSNKADTLNIWCKNSRIWQLLRQYWNNKQVFPVVNVLKCVVTEVVVFNCCFDIDISHGSVATYYYKFSPDSVSKKFDNWSIFYEVMRRTESVQNFWSTFSGTETAIHSSDISLDCLSPLISELASQCNFAINRTIFCVVQK